MQTLIERRVESLKNEGLEANNKTRVYRVFSWQQTLGL